jgi:hypothetical protein
MNAKLLPFIDIRSSVVGEQAYVRGSSLAVWEIVLLTESYDGDLAAVAKHLEWPLVKVEAAVRYAREFPEEIARALRENSSADFDSLKRMLPDISESRLPTTVSR